MNIMYGSNPESKIDNLGHIGGLIAGIFCGYSFLGLVNEGQ